MPRLLEICRCVISNAQYALIYLIFVLKFAVDEVFWLNGTFMRRIVLLFRFFSFFLFFVFYGNNLDF